MTPCLASTLNCRCMTPTSMAATRSMTVMVETVGYWYHERVVDRTTLPHLPQQRLLAGTLPRLSGPVLVTLRDQTITSRAILAVLLVEEVEPQLTGGSPTLRPYHGSPPRKGPQPRQHGRLSDNSTQLSRIWTLTMMTRIGNCNSDAHETRREAFGEHGGSQHVKKIRPERGDVTSMGDNHHPLRAGGVARSGKHSTWSLS